MFRLLQNQIDGKLVEVEPSAFKINIEIDDQHDMQTQEQDIERQVRGEASVPKDITSVSMFNKKGRSLNDEYTEMLASTLESQRVFYHMELQRM